jgi:RNA polymerase sigma-70 factor (ECF subfamily)
MSPLPHAFDADYVNALRHGDPATEAHFADYFNPILLRSLRRKVRCADEARDIRQETFLRVLSAVRRSQGVRHPERFEFFVMSVCNNIVRETYRRQGRSVALADLKEEPPAACPSADVLVLTGEIQGKVRRMLSQMGQNEQGILEAMFLEGQSRDEICRRLGVNRAHLRVLLCRAKKRLRSHMGRDLRRPVVPRRSACA